MGILSGVGKTSLRYVRDNRTQLIAAAVSLLVFLLLWHFAAWASREYEVGFRKFLPYPVDVFEALVSSFENVPGLDRAMGPMILASLGRLLIGFGIAMALAYPLGLLMGTVKMARYFGMPVIEVFRPIPPVAWIPIFVVVFVGIWGPVAVVFLGAFFPMLLNVMFGVRRTDQTLIDAARTLGASNRDVVYRIIVPSTLPYLVAGMKIGLGIGWMCIVAAEMLPVTGSGVGDVLWKTAMSYSLYDYTYACMIIIAVLSAVTTGMVNYAERRLYRWMGMS